MTPFTGVASATLSFLALVTPTTSAQLHSPPRAVDDNPDPRIVETVLTAAERDLQLVPGKKTRVMTYNGTIPGPTIEAEVGDRIVVHLVNLLGEPTTIHWHGMETPAHMDGSELAQAVVPPSAHFRYEFVANNAGTYWYHPHTNTNEQIEKGLYGAVIVRDPTQDARIGIPRENELIVFLDDVKLDKDNQIAPFSTDPRSEFIPWKRAEDLVNSRVGTHKLVNGRYVSQENLQTIDVLSGAPYRIRLISVTSGHLWRLSIPANAATFYGIGSDQGLWNEAEVIRPIEKVKDFRGHHDLLISNFDARVGVTLTPSDRAETVLVAKGENGSTIALEGHDFIKGKHISFRGPEGELQFGHDHFDGAEEPMQLLRFRVIGRKADAWQPPKPLRDDPVVPLEVDLSSDALPVFFGHGMPDKTTGDVMFFLNVDRGSELLASVHAKKVTLPIDFLPLPMMKLRAGDGYHVRLGETRAFEVVNFTGSDHNFHVHGFPFQHIDTRYVDLDEPANNRTEKPLRLAFEDTLRVPKRPGLVLGRSYTILRVAMRFDDSTRPPHLRRRPEEIVAGGIAPGVNRSGGWLVHCHFLEHGSKGMMSFITVRR